MFEEFGYLGDELYPLLFFKAAGSGSTITPNICIDKNLEDFTVMDVLEGGSCSYDENTGLPVLGTNNTLKSSIMAFPIPYLQDSNQFCDDTDLLKHRSDIPNKHNDKCNQQSTFTVIKQHPDFYGYVQNNTIENRTTSFKILYPKASSSIVLVMDVSAQMNENCIHKPEPCESRIDRLKHSVMRWMEYDVNTGARLGIVKFHTNVDKVHPLVGIDEKNRPKFTRFFGSLKSIGGTCIGAGLRGGLETLLDGNVTKGGVLILLTGGAQKCDGNDQSTALDVMNLVKEQKAWVIVIVFGNDADPDILTLAQETNGKAFFVPDNVGPAFINSALQGYLTYQPSLPSTEWTSLCMNRHSELKKILQLISLLMV